MLTNTYDTPQLHMNNFCNHTNASVSSYSTEEATSTMLQEGETMKNILYPGNHDVMLGRGGESNYHPGNLLFRTFIQDRKHEYQAARKQDKPIIAMEVVMAWRELEPPGRFLARVEPSKADSLWYDVGDDTAGKRAGRTLGEKMAAQPSATSSSSGPKKTAAFSADRPCSSGKTTKAVARDTTAGGVRRGQANDPTSSIKFSTVSPPARKPLLSSSYIASFCGNKRATREEEEKPLASSSYIANFCGNQRLATRGEERGEERLERSLSGFLFDLRSPPPMGASASAVSMIETERKEHYHNMQKMKKQKTDCSSQFWPGTAKGRDIMRVNQEHDLNFNIVMEKQRMAATTGGSQQHLQLPGAVPCEAKSSSCAVHYDVLRPSCWGCAVEAESLNQLDISDMFGSDMDDTLKSGHHRLIDENGIPTAEYLTRNVWD